jgi:hypothetical protein
MSHHLDSPLARRDPRLNISDQYVFDDRNATVFVLNVRASLAGDGPIGFHPGARYEFRVHLDGAAVENLTFGFAFEPEADGVQAYRVVRPEGDAAADDAVTGTNSCGRTGRAVDGPDGLRVWAGRALRLDRSADDLADLPGRDG